MLIRCLARFMVAGMDIFSCVYVDYAFVCFFPSYCLSC